MTKNNIENLKFLLHKRILKVQSTIGDINRLVKSGQLTMCQYHDILNMITLLRLNAEKNGIKY